MQVHELFHDEQACVYEIFPSMSELGFRKIFPKYENLCIVQCEQTGIETNLSKHEQTWKILKQ